MKEYIVDVRITPRGGLLDPQGKAVQGALRSLGFDTLGDVSVGRLVRLHLSAESAEAARGSADEMCRKLLANPVTEDYSIDLGEG